ncbi:uncharacterized protein LTR77_004535 [Saxophila tyrrhenica]|uniref:Uncharacterized protein n=1 Tax=Saxophila tyrrhenica TaxID=1690608 RepID=A0AAV9PDC9_9PEZI|nr:hypothetical protein LTR77_004535 [Saxophila tyrrhenica]
MDDSSDREQSESQGSSRGRHSNARDASRNNSRGRGSDRLAVPAPEETRSPESIRNEDRYFFPSDSTSPSRTTRSASQNRLGDNASTPALPQEAHSTYGVTTGEKMAAKIMASKVAVDGAPSPNMALITALNPGVDDLAAAIEFAGEVIVDNCSRLQEVGDGHTGAAVYLGIWVPITSDGADRIKEAPESLLRYTLHTCLQAVEEVHNWANIGSGGIMTQERIEAAQADFRRTQGVAPNALNTHVHPEIGFNNRKEFNYRKEHNLSVTEDDDEEGSENGLITWQK